MMNWWIAASILVLQSTLAVADDNEIGRAENEVPAKKLWYHQMYNSVDRYWSYCGHMKWAFDTHTHICCNGYIRPKLGPRYLNRCCGTLSYNRRTHWCCEGKIRRNYLNNEFAKPRCCGRSSYNPSNQICCNGVIVSTKVTKNSFGFNACCGRSSYNPFEKTCCSGEVQGLVGGFLHTQCCGARSIDTRRAKCCSQVVRSTSDPRNTKCCGKSLIDTRWEKCCNQRKGVVAPIWENCLNGQANGSQ